MCRFLTNDKNSASAICLAQALLAVKTGGLFAIEEIIL